MRNIGISMIFLILLFAVSFVHSNHFLSTSAFAQSNNMQSTYKSERNPFADLIKSQEYNSNGRCNSEYVSEISCNNMGLNADSVKVPASSVLPIMQDESSIKGKTYIISGNLQTGNPVTSDAKCNPGDSVIGGSFSLDVVSGSIQLQRDFPVLDSPEGWEAFVQGNSGSSFGLMATALCFDNP